MNEPRLNLSFTGICSFCRMPICTNLDQLEADVAIIGAPYDLGTQSRSGTRYGPRAIREASTRYRGGYYDFELDEEFLTPEVRIVDCGDADMIHANPHRCLENIGIMVGKVLERGALPVVIGGDHSVPIPILPKLESKGPLCVVQFDAHLDFVDEKFGVKIGHGNPMRRISELNFVSGMAQIGIRGPGSSGKQDFMDALEYGSRIIGMREIRKFGIEEVVSKIPDAERYYVTIDCDVLDPSIAPGNGSPSLGGMTYEELRDTLEGITKKGEVVGFDFLEVAPMYDPTQVTPLVAARIILDFLGFIFRRKT